MKMPLGEADTPTLLLQFVKDSLPMIGGIIAVWKTISELAKYFSVKQEAKLKELIRMEVTPKFDKLQDSLEKLEQSNDRLRESIDKIKYGK